MPKVYNRHHGSAPRKAVYVGRGTPWGNPFVVGMHGTLDQVLTQFHRYLLASPDLMHRARVELEGRDLICSCAPHRCHADILMAIANDWPMPSWIAQQQLDFSTL